MSSVFQIEQKSNFYKINIDKNFSIISYVLPFGYESKEMKRGYAHLFEHMVIQSNQSYFNYLEQSSINYNAETQSDQIIFTFIDISGNKLDEKYNNISKIFVTPFSQSCLDIEKKTILQEYEFMKNRYSIASIDRSIGNTEEIENFNIKSLEEYRMQLLNKYDIIYIGNFLNFNNNIPTELFKNWHENINFLKCSVTENALKIELTEGIEAEILAYCLKILYTLNDISIVRSEKILTIEIPDNYDGLKKRIEEKDLYFFRYILLTDTIKMLCNEAIYYVEHLPVNLDTEAVFLNNEWEKKVIEAFIE